jgi:Flp pilus assembly pilin Flp
MKFSHKKAQSTLEYAVIIAVIAAALVAMNVYMKRGMQGKLRESADKIGEQYSAGRTTSLYTTEQAGESTTKETFGLADDETTRDQGVSHYKVVTPAEIKHSAQGADKETVEPLVNEPLFDK